MPGVHSSTHTPSARSKSIELSRKESAALTFGRAIRKKTVPSVMGNALSASHYMVGGSQSATSFFPIPMNRVGVIDQVRTHGFVTG